MAGQSQAGDRPFPAESPATAEPACVGEQAGALIVLISNFPDEQAAYAACSRLLDEGLIACANIQAPCRSLYRWNEGLQDDTEVPVWLKTSPVRAAAARARLAQLHPYDVPEILVLDVQANSAYARWVDRETRP